MPHSRGMSPRRRCQVPGCTYPSVSDLPVAPDGLPSLSEVAAASLRGCCRDHLAVVSNTYAAAVDWALLGDRAVGGPPTRQAVQEICDRLGTMDTYRTRSLYRLLECATGVQ